MVTLGAFVLLGQITSAQPKVQVSQATVKISRGLFQKLGVRKVKRAPNISRKWVFDRRINVSQIRPIKLDPYATLDVNLHGKIEAAKIEVEDQGERGTCTIFATKFLAEYEMARQHNFLISFRLNPEYLNWAANKAEGANWDGSSFPAVCDGLALKGCCYWHEDKTYSKYVADYDPNYNPLAANQQKAKQHTNKVDLSVIFQHQNAGMTQSDMNMVLGLLDAGIPVGVGQQWPAGGTWKSTTVDGFSILEGTGPVDGAHTMAIVGYKKNPAAPGGGYFLFRNSWGTSATNDGYLTMSFDWVRKHTYDGCVGSEFQMIL